MKKKIFQYYNMGKKLSSYQKKRNFDKTTEPWGSKRPFKLKPLFVIQKHDATNLHYDFRLEIDGVLKSWAVPKGPSTDPSVKRLAMLTEDHPIAYGNFEGVIPAGQYGAGTVMVWDYGKYKNIKKENGKIASMKKCFEKGEIEIELKGKKLQGGYALIKMKARGGKQWLLIKKRDDKADARRNPVSSEPKSVISKKTLKQIAKEKNK